MEILSSFMKIIKHIVYVSIKNFGTDKLYLRLWFHSCNGYWMDFNNPQTFSEKLQWLKLYNRKDIYTTMVDKYLVKKYVSDIIGKEYIIPTLGVWNKVEDIDFDNLPQQFVLKPTHDSGINIICKDKSKLDRLASISQMKLALKRDFFKETREWPYKNVKRRIIAEAFMVDKNSDNKDLIDYKFYCFDGVPQFCQVIRDRRSKETIDFYDMNWNHMPFIGMNPLAYNGETPVIKPSKLLQMIDICKQLSAGIPFIRVDLYEINNKVYFGELTFFPSSGDGGFCPSEWNLKLGNLISLSSK